MLYHLVQPRTVTAWETCPDTWASTQVTEIRQPLHIANAIFVDHAYALQNDFAQNFLDYFRGNAMMVDFGSQDAVDAVNQWAYDNTNGRIAEVI